MAQNCKPSNNAPQYWLVQKVQVKANAVTQYETHVKMLVNELQNYSEGCSPFNWFAFVSPEQAVYTYVTPVQDFMHLQDIYQTMNREGSVYAKLHDAISEEVLSWDVSFLMPLPNLSYMPQNAQANIQPYNIIESLEVMPGKQMQFEKAMMNWVSSSKQANATTGWTVFTTVMGPNQPEYSIVYNGSSMASFKAQLLAMTKSGTAEQAKGFGVLRGYSWSSNVFAPELSNINAPHPRGAIPRQ